MNEKKQFPDDETCWNAIVTRDASYNGVVYVGVKTTGIYCRPTCPARRPFRENVVFFPSWEAAEAAGFRACRRCLPRQSADPALELVTRTRALIEASDEPLTLAELGERLGASPFHLQRVFKAATGLTPRQYTAGLRANAFKAEARRGADVTSALYAAGYGSSTQLYESASATLGMTPGAYRDGGKGMTVYYTIVESGLGLLLVAGTERGISAVALDDSAETLTSTLAAEFPKAELIPTGQAPADCAERLAAWAEAVRASLDGTRPDLDLPLDVLGTAFQQRVWAELRRIPYGETRTYAQVAQSIGQPSAVRAVAHACASNPAALVTPCHRVIRTDGSLGGYRWGLTRKKAILATEKAGK